MSIKPFELANAMTKRDCQLLFKVLDIRCPLTLRDKWLLKKARA